MKLDMNLTSLGEVGSAADWVKLSRDMEKERQLAEQRRKQYEEVLRDSDEDEDQSDKRKKSVSALNIARANGRGYGASDLKGLKVMHGSAAFEEQEEVILTLADTSVLATDEHGRTVGINEDEDDVLENINLAEQERRLEAKKRASRLKQPIYQGYDDEEFQGSVGVKPSILAHYDQEKKTGPRLVLGEGGVAAGEAQSAAPAAMAGKVLQSLHMTVKPAASFLSFKDVKAKRGARAREVRQGASMRRPLGGEDEAEDGRTATDNSSKPSKAKDSSRVGGLGGGEDGEDEGYDLADILAGAEDQDAPEHQTHGDSHDVSIKQERKYHQVSAAPANRPAPRIVRAAVEEREEDDEVQAAIARARQQALQLRRQQERAEGGASGALQALQLLKALPASDDQNSSSGDLAGESDGRIVFNDVLEFSTRLSATLNDRARHRAEAALRDVDRPGEAGGAGSGGGAGAMNDEASANMDMDVDSPFSSDAEDGDGDGDEQDGDQVDNEGADPFALPLASKGLGAALSLLRQSGDLKKRGGDLMGRARDQRAVDPTGEVAGAGVQIEYYDDHGRKLTQKEAFRQLSYKFHGQQPGRKKREKRLKTLALQALTTSSRAGVLTGEGGSMGALTATQAATGRAHIVVQGGGGGTGGAAVAGDIVRKLAEEKVKRKRAREEK